MRPKHPLKWLLRAAKLSRSMFFYHQGAGLRGLVRRARAAYRRDLRSHQAMAALRQGSELVSHKTVQKRMRTLGLNSPVRAKKYRSYLGQSHEMAANALARDFEAMRPDEKRVT